MRGLGPQYWLAGISLVMVCVLIVLGVNPPEIIPKHQPIDGWALDRLMTHMDTIPDVMLFVGVPVDDPEHWVIADSYSDGKAVLRDGLHVDLAVARSVILAYDNGDYLDGVSRSLALPDWLHYTNPPDEIEPIPLDLSALEEGRATVDVAHTRAPARPTALEHYTTTLTNLSEEAWRIVSFRTHQFREGEWHVYQIFDPNRFSVWYDAPDDGWLLPDQSVQDPANYGGPIRGYCWVYEFENKDGARLVTGRVFEGHHDELETQPITVDP